MEQFKGNQGAEITMEDNLKIAKAYEGGDHPYYEQNLESDNKKDLQDCVDNDELVGLVSEVHGGIIGYVQKDVAITITSMLNLQMIEKLKK